MTDPEISVHADRASAAPTRPPPAFEFEEPPTRPWKAPPPMLRRKPPPLPPRPTPSVQKAMPSTFPKHEPVLETVVALTEKELPLVIVQNHKEPSVAIPLVVVSDPLEDVSEPEPPASAPLVVVAPIVAIEPVVEPPVVQVPVVELPVVEVPVVPVDPPAPVAARPGTTTVITARRRTALAALENAVVDDDVHVEPTWLPRRRRWRVRLAMLVVLVVGEVALANRTRPIAIPHDTHELARAFHAALATPPSASHAARATGAEDAVADRAAPVAPPEAAPDTEVTSEPREGAPLAAAAANLAPGTGVLDTTGAPPNRRIFVDDRTVGQTPRAEVVTCGAHKVQIGSAGHARTIDVPCGAAVRVDEL